MASLYWIGGASGNAGNWSTASNWSTGSVPVDGDEVVIDGRSTNAITSGLNQSAVTLASLRIDLSNAYNVGTATAPLQVGATICYIGRDETSGATGSGASLVNIDFGSVQTACYVYGSPNTGSDGIEPVILKGTHASNVVHVYGGVVGVATADPADVATVATLNVEGGRATCSNGCTLTTVNQDAGTLFLEAAATTINQHAGTLETIGSGAITTANVSGTARFNSTGTITTLNVYGSGLADFSNNAAARTVTNASKFSNSARINAATAAPLAITFTNGIDCQRCGIEGIDFGTHVTVTPSSI